MSFTIKYLNIDPKSDDLPPINDSVYSMTLFPRAHKRDCVNCGLRHSSHSSVGTAYCNHCKYAASDIFSWYKHRTARKRLLNGIFVLNLMSRCIHVGEIGICDNVMSFL